MSEQVVIEIFEEPSIVVEVVEEGGVKVVEIFYPGPQGPPGSGGSHLSVRVDASTPGVIYVGTAPDGAAPGSNVWIVTRSLFSLAGVRTSRGRATGTTWTNRALHTYT
jgi:hypothetical protein